MTASFAEPQGDKGVLTIWHVQLQSTSQRFVQKIIPIGLDEQGKRNRPIETAMNSLASLHPTSTSVFSPATRREFVTVIVPDMLRRDLVSRPI